MNIQDHVGQVYAIAGITYWMTQRQVLYDWVREMRPSVGMVALVAFTIVAMWPVFLLVQIGFRLRTGRWS